MLPYDEHTPTYELQKVQWLVGQGALTCSVSRMASRGGEVVSLDRNGIIAVVLSLEPQDFYKTMESEQRPGLWQDVYHKRYGVNDLYIKLQIDADGRAVIIHSSVGER